MMVSDSGRLRRCSSTHPDDPTVRCQGEVVDASTHVEDHWSNFPNYTVRWNHLNQPIDLIPANPERIESEAEQTEQVMKQPFGDYDIGAQILAEADARHQQVGGDHYRTFRIQPWDVIDEYGLSYYAGVALKYLLRDKGSRLEDLKKCRHVLDKMIELEKEEE